MPSSYTDALALIHDVDYLRYSGLPEYEIRSDTKAIDNAGFLDLQGLSMKLGLGIKQLLELQGFNPTLQGYTDSQTRSVGWQLHQYLASDPKYVKMFKDYGLSIH